MKLVDVEQGSEAWVKARLGIPTASMFHHILTPKTLKPSSSADDYLIIKLAERILGHTVDEEEFNSGFSIRGTTTEAEAVSAYELVREVDTTKVGFALHDSGLFGCSPDRLVGDDGGMQIKCFGVKHHLRALLGVMEPKVMLQVQGELYVTGRKWWDVMFYNPAFAYRIVRVKPDADIQAALGIAVNEFCVRLDKATKQYKAEYGGDTVGTGDVEPEPKKEKKARPAHVTQEFEKGKAKEPWDETPVNTKSAEETKAAAQKEKPKGPSDADPKREFFGALKNWVGPDGEPVVSTKSAANMRTLMGGLLKRTVTSDAMTEADWSEALDEFIGAVTGNEMTPANWKDWCAGRLVGAAKKEMKKVEKENDLSLDDFEPVSVSKAMTVETLLNAAKRHRTDDRVFFAERGGKMYWVDKRTLVAAELEVKVTELAACDPTELQALHDALVEEMK